MDPSISGLNALIKSLQARLSAVESKVGGSPPPAASAGGAASGAGTIAEVDDGDVAAYVMEFDEFLASKMAPFVKTAQSIGGDAVKLANAVESSFKIQRHILTLVRKCKKPDPAKLLKGVGKGIPDAAMAADALIVRGSPFEFHAKGLKEGLMSGQWVVIDMSAHGMVEAQRDSAEFWLNKVRKEHKGKSDGHMDFCTQFKALINGLYAFVKANAKMGLPWNGGGKDISEAAGASTASAPAPAAADPPANPLAAAIAGGASHLKKKGGKKKGGGGKKKAASGSGGKAAGKGKAKKVKAPSLKLIGKRWFCEHQVAGEPVVVEVENRRQQVYIANCTDATIIVKGKCNAMACDKLVRCKVLFDSAISSCGVVDCKKLKLQVKEKVPSISIDKTDGCVIYLSHASRGTEVSTSKSSEMNISFPITDAEDSEWKEMPIPEQFVATIKPDGSGVTCKVSELYSS